MTKTKPVKCELHIFIICTPTYRILIKQIDLQRTQSNSIIDREEMQKLTMT